jgi:hypothetical protein
MEKKWYSYKQNFLHSEGNYNKLDERENTIDLKQMQLLCIMMKVQRP